MKRYLSCVTLASVLAGCSGPAAQGGEPAYWVRPGASTPSNETTSLMYYANYVRTMDGADRDRELDRVRTAYQKDKSDFHRMQYAIALGAGSLAERKQALQLLDGWPSGRGHDPELGALASLLSSQLQGQVLWQRRADELERKLEGVKDIERSLMQREKGRISE